MVYFSTFLDGGYNVWSGTSMTAPHVTSLVALMLQAYGDLSPDMVRAMLHSSAVDIGTPYPLVQFP